MLKIRKLRCLHMKDPLGIDETPYFSWVLESDQYDIMQESYRIQVTDETGSSVWDTGYVISERSTFVEYAGDPLSSCTRYRWIVDVTDKSGECAFGEAFFETAFLNKKEWTAQWIKYPFSVMERGAHLGEQPPAVFFRQKIFLNGKINRARLYATCHGVYQLSINGKRPDDREFAPECSVYRSCLYYQTYDVTDLLREGENVIGMHVGDGWYHGFMTRAEDVSYDPAPAVLTQIEIRYEDGRTCIYGSDDTVLTKESPVRCSDLFAGEKYDARMSSYGWDEPGYDDAGWTEGSVATFDYGTLTAQYGQPVRPVCLLPLKKVFTSPRGERILDFGQVIAGRLRLKIDVPAGTKITILHTEGLDAEGNFFDNNPTADQRIEYISDGKAQVYEPHFTFQGFRYVMIDGLEELDEAKVQAVVLSTEKENAGTFACSDPDITRLYKNTRWSQLANMLSIPTDCPQREKAGWTGDIQVYAKAGLLNEDLTPFLTRWLKNLALEQRENGSVPFVVPLAGAYVGQYEMYAQQYQTPDAVAPAGWSDAAVLIPLYMYQLTGNEQILKQQYSSMKKWCDFVLRTAWENRPENDSLPDEIEHFLYDTGFHYGEHMIPSYSRDGYGDKTFEAIRESQKYIAPLYGWYSVRCMSRISELLGEREDAAQYREAAEKMKFSIQKGIIGQDGKMPGDLMGAYALMIYYGLVPEEQMETFAANLVRKLEENGGCLDTGFLATPILLDALCRIGHGDLAYDLLFQDKAPSWLYEVRHGATTIWESWFALDENGAPFVSEIYGMKFCMSLNHYAFGCVDDWMFRNIGGICWKKPGFKEIVIQPRIDSRLTWAERSYESEYGTISVNWRIEDNIFTMDVVIPCNTTAEVILPDHSNAQVGSGTYRYTCCL